jgi:hypothetical protein
MALKRVGMLVIALAALWSIVAPPVSGPDHSAFDLSVTAAYAGDPDDYQGAPPPPPPDSTSTGDQDDEEDSGSASGGGSLLDKVTRFIASLLP